MINKIIGKYRIVKLIGEGGMAAVYEAEHEMLGTKVAIKVLNPVLSANNQIKERFRNEARLMASLDHPNITKVIDFDEQPQQLSIVMEFLNGSDLNKKIRRDGPISSKELVDIFYQTLVAFQYAHEKGVVHRDIKPSNIFILDDGRVKILDFGIAKLFGQGNEMTLTGTQMGTPIYMSPEQVIADKTIDRRSDIYSLGISMFYAINGKTPYNSETDSQFEIFTKIVYEPLQEFTVQSPFKELVLKACNKDRELRFQNCSAFLSALEAVSNVKPELDERTIVDSRPVSQVKLRPTVVANKVNQNNQFAPPPIIPTYNLNPPSNRKKWLIPAVFIGAVALIGLVLVFLFAIQDDDSDEDGIIDKYDACPYSYEPVSGCPDFDKDGVSDKDDDCPNIYGLIQGCPDSDKDGLIDNDDACPNIYGLIQGCPDGDGDGLIDKDDACPEIAGNAGNGCPYHKQVTFTNNSSSRAYLCFAYNHENHWVSEGWYTVEAHENVTYDLPDHFTGDEVFWYGDDDNNGEWRGTDKNFIVAKYGNGGFKVVDGVFEYSGGGIKETRGFNRLYLTGEITKNTIYD